MRTSYRIIVKNLKLCGKVSGKKIKRVWFQCEYFNDDIIIDMIIRKKV